MVMIIGCHIVSFIAYNGDKFYGDFYILGSLINRVFLGMLAAFGRIGVGLFFFITGYFHIFKQTVDFKRTLYKTVFYAIIINIIVIILYFINHNISPNDFKESIKTILLPITHGHYWFITAYVFLCLSIPSINIILRKLTEKKFLIILFFIFFFGNFLGEYIGALFYNLQRAFIFYCLGSYYKIFFESRRFHKKATFVFFMILILIIIFIYSFLEMQRMDMLTYNESLTRKERLIFYIGRLLENCLLEPITVFCIFTLSLNIKIKNNSLINLIGKTTLGVYLLHTATGFSSFLYLNICNIKISYTTNLFIPKSLFLCVTIFMFCSLIDLIYIFFIEPVQIRIYKKIIGDIL